MDLKKLFFSEISFKPATQNGTHHKETQQQNCPQQQSNGQSDFQEPRRQLCSPDIIKLDWQQSERVGSGLINAGNTCFLNSVLQCLSYCPPLVNFLLHTDGGHSKNCKINDFCMLCEMERHIKRIRDPSKHAIKPVYIYQRLKYINKSFQFGRQEDAHEFLRYLIDHMWKACLQNCGVNGFKLDPKIKETTVINHIFGGYHRSQVVCLVCKSRSNTFDFFMDFILDIRNAPSLERALERFTYDETLQNENAYKCSKCKKKVAAKKRFTVHKAPNVATFQLKRFDSNRIFGGKITKHISYPEELDLRPYMSDPSKTAIRYKLNAVLVHVGHSSDSGHYYCFIKNSNGYWYRMDDASVTQVSLDNVLNQQAYVLFYTKSNDQINGYSSKISTWFGNESKLTGKRPSEVVSDRDEFNDELDRGKVKKMKNLAREERFSNASKSNPFQQYFSSLSNGKQQNHHGHHGGGGGSGGGGNHRGHKFHHKGGPRRFDRR